MSVTTPSTISCARMRLRAVPLLTSALLTLLLQACSQASVQPVQTAQNTTAPAPIPELNLNLPEQSQCVCEVPSRSDYTFLEKGFVAVTAGEYVEAVQYFQRYQRLESSPDADWEAAVAIAFVSSLSSSPLYDAEATRKSYRQLRKEDWQAMQLHQQILLMRHALESFLMMDRHMRDLESVNATLKEDLEKREDALKRLRELTLRQRGAAQ